MSTPITKRVSLPDVVLQEFELIWPAIPILGNNLPKSRLCEIGQDVKKNYCELAEWPVALAAHAYIYYVNMIVENNQQFPDEPDIGFVPFLIDTLARHKRLVKNAPASTTRISANQ